MRIAVAILVAALVACALLSAHQHKPFKLLVSARSPGQWVEYAQAPIMPGVMICKPMLIPRHQSPETIVSA